MMIQKINFLYMGNKHDLDNKIHDDEINLNISLFYLNINIVIILLMQKIKFF